MKNKAFRAVAVLLAAVLIFAVTGCSSAKEISVKPFTRGTVSGNTYHSDFAELTFTAPDGWHFYSDEELSSLLGTTKDLLEDPEAFEKLSEGEMIDFFAIAGDGSLNVDMSYAKGSMLTNLEASRKSSIDLIKDQYEQMGFSCTAAEPVDRTLGERTFSMTELSVDIGSGTMTQYFYVAMIGSYFVTVTATATVDTPPETFEAMFS